MGRTALVVGGSRGTGHATARALAGDGHRDAVTYCHSAPPADFLSFQCDVSNTASVDAAFTGVEQELGPVEIAVVNAGVTRDRILLRMTEEDLLSGNPEIAIRAHILLYLGKHQCPACTPRTGETSRR